LNTHEKFDTQIIGNIKAPDICSMEFHHFSLMRLMMTQLYLTTQKVKVHYVQLH